MTEIMTNRELMLTLGRAARDAAKALALASTAQKNEALMAMAAKIRRSAADIPRTRSAKAMLSRTLRCGNSA